MLPPAADYSMGVAPDGREGIFTALASAPLFAAMLPTGGWWGRAAWISACCCTETGLWELAPAHCIGAVVSRSACEVHAPPAARHAQA